jgi:hypothetical protein
MSNTKTVGIGEAVGLILGLIGMGIQMRWPEQRWLGWIFISAGIAIGFGIILWVVAQRFALREFTQSTITQSPAFPTQTGGIDFKPHIEVNPVISQTQSKEQSERQSQVKANVRPEIECTDCYVIKGSLSGVLIREVYI